MKTTDILTPSAFLPTLPVGTPLTFELRYKDKIKAFGGASRLIGYREKKYILLETPTDPELSKLLTDTSGMQAVVRGLTSSRYGEIFAFKSHILSVLHRPEKMIAIELPPQVSIHRMRSDARYAVSRIVHLIIDGRKALAKLSDFSLSGCAIRVSSSQFIDEGETIGFVINALFDHPVEFEGTVMNVTSNGDGVQLGIKFSDASKSKSRDTLAKLILASELSADNSNSAVSTVS
ncbi:PilZ domain-containing protein [Grimontia sp. NTOU-MAR1]|uniref:PilZ domain-containing protein n=1 Tax=Grimontia sp. NTOU-MAR1 TaxID=3111011 RepID=UPI002DBEAE79|nr:PilZ domain-containing protein [Grimontia sp. NTOU-MAR1]WRV99643.1 PilZ domain-containing protein [Grimontia sp. NTOU-MAR1]